MCGEHELPGRRHLATVSSDINVLERVALDPDAATKLALAVQHTPAVAESAVLATCNRTEVYATVDRFHAGMDEVTAILSDVTGVPLLDLAEHLYVHFEEGAVAHLFQVAVGLDSMIVGESQILGQVKESLRVGQDLETIGTDLNALLQHALRVGKRARAETGIDSAGRSVVSAGLDAVGGFEGRRALIVGAGSMASLAAQTLLNGGAASVTIANRNYDRAVALAERVGGTAIQLADVPDALADADLVVSLHRRARRRTDRGDDPERGRRAAVRRPGRRPAAGRRARGGPDRRRHAGHPGRPGRYGGRQRARHRRGTADRLARRRVRSRRPGGPRRSRRPWSRCGRWRPSWSTSELARLDRRLPGLDDEPARTRSPGPSAGWSTRCCTPRRCG